jgi:HEAT repeat protein
MPSLGSRPLAEVVRVLGGSDRQQRLSAISELARRGSEGDAAVVPPLIAALNVPASADKIQSHAEWEYCVEVLEQIGEAAVDLLLGTLSDRGQPERVRSGAVRALGNIGHPRATQSLLKILQDQSEDLEFRRMAAAYLGRTKDRTATQHLLALAKDAQADSTLRCNAIRSLEWLSDPNSFEDLVFLLQDAAVASFQGRPLNR